MYTEVVENNFLYQHQVHDNNNRRHAPISIERTWDTKYWPGRYLSWYLSVSDVIVNCARAYFQDISNALPQLGFRRIFSKELLENTIGRYWNGWGSGVGLRSRIELHEIITKLPFTRKWISNTRRWHKVKGQYHQSRCHKCSK